MAGQNIANGRAMCLPGVVGAARQALATTPGRPPGGGFAGLEDLADAVAQGLGGAQGDAAFGGFAVFAEGTDAGPGGDFLRFEIADTGQADGLVGGQGRARDDGQGREGLAGGALAEAGQGAELDKEVVMGEEVTHGRCRSCRGRLSPG